MGTAIMVVSAGLSAIFLAGIRLRIIMIAVILIGSAAPLLWHVMHDYQKQRILTLLNPEQDPLGSGYHIIQSKIAIGSGGYSEKAGLKEVSHILTSFPNMPLILFLPFVVKSSDFLAALRLSFYSSWCHFAVCKLQYRLKPVTHGYWLQVLR